MIFKDDSSTSQAFAMDTLQPSQSPGTPEGHRMQSLEGLAEILSKRYTLSRKVNTYRQHLHENWRPEMFCILACEAGEKASEFGLYLAGSAFWDTLSLPLGFAAGGAYATVHVYRHARNHSRSARWMDAAAYAATTESGCVVGATTTEWAAGQLAGAQTPFDPYSLSFSAAGVPIAFGVGLGLMSLFSYYHAHEAYRGIAHIGQAADTINDKSGELKEYGLSAHVKPNGRRISITGERHTLTLREKRLPGHLRADGYGNGNCLLLARTPPARHSTDAKERTGAFVSSYLPDIVHQGNIYACQHSHGAHEDVCHHHAH